jgi:hypothetical protein
VGGEVRGNYCTLNPLKIGTNATLSNGNLDFTSSATTGYNTVLGTIGVSSGKWYWEITATASASNGFGIANDKVNINDYLGGDANGWMYYQNTGTKYNNNTGTPYGSSYTTNDVIGFAFDADAGSITAYKNGVSQGVMYSSLAAGTYFPAVSDSGVATCSSTANFGQRPFAYTAPSGFKALNTSSLPTPLVTKPSTVMDVALYTGNGSTQTISGLGFSPDFVWTKTRSQANNNFLFDSVRGVGNWLISDLTTAETYSANTLTSFNSDGFTTGSNNDTNGSGRTFVAWAWDAGSSTVTNTQGSITSQVRANASAGFSIITATQPVTANLGCTVGHGLGVAPSMYIVKDRDLSINWGVYHSGLSSPATQALQLSTTSAAFTATNYWKSTSPTSSVLSIGTSIVGEGNDFVVYAFAPVAGYSSFGSYTGNGSADGPFVYTGMRPRYLLLKQTNTTRDWLVYDSARDDYNAAYKYLYPNLSNTEGTNPDTLPIDFLSNGFKLRASNATANQSAGTYIYAAFAESPFQSSRAR